jgi:DNA-directed RNA polymerase specialized sigma24 family protein
VAEKASGGRGPGDADLLNQVRTGDTTAFGVLYQRHVDAVRRLARELVMSPAEADHLVAETFAVVHDVTQRGGGPTDAFRPYVLTALRRVAADQVRDLRLPTTGHPDLGDPLTLPGAAGPDASEVAGAFLSLPERWRAVLWHADIEDEPSAEIAPLLGASRADVADLRRNARDGLRQAIVRDYVARAARPDCGKVADRLDEYQREALAPAETASVRGHLTECADCAAVGAALGGITAALRNQVAPLFLGPAALQYLLGSHNAIPAKPGTPSPADTREFGAVAAGATASLAAPLTWLARLRHSSGIRHPSPPRHPSGPRHPARLALVRLAQPRRVWVGVASVLAAGAVAAVAIAATGGPGGDANQERKAASCGTSLDNKAGPGLSQPAVRSPEPSGSPRPRSATHSRRAARPTPSASTSTAPQTTAPPATTAPAPTPSATPAAMPALTASVSVDGSHFFHTVSFQVTDTGGAATGQLTATITLPSGARFIGGPRQSAGWSCTAASGGASCQHAAISAGGQAPGMIFIIASGQACGQTVQLSAASGSASANAQSGQGIQCNQ